MKAITVNNKQHFVIDSQNHKGHTIYTVKNSILGGYVYYIAMHKEFNTLKEARQAIDNGQN